MSRDVIWNNNSIGMAKKEEEVAIDDGRGGAMKERNE